MAEIKSYADINDYRKEEIKKGSWSNIALNEFHDLVYKMVVEFSLKEIESRLGNPPVPFSFFVMGSAGRFEQSIWSDQDHGIVYESELGDARQYFLELGTEISNGLELAGYPKCAGSVMASNTLWCKSTTDWQLQLEGWVQDSSWKSIRNTLIFADARALVGEGTLVSSLKDVPFKTADRPTLLLRMLHNTSHLKKGVGVLGQVLVETQGTFTGSINIKETALLPYVNSARLLASIDGIDETSTLSRISHLSDAIMPSAEKKIYWDHFSRLIEYRLKHGNHLNYDTGHYLDVENLSKHDKKTLKDLLKTGEQLFDKTRRIIERMT